ncbi:tricalbin [Multifurca ochricompacta]|uniref:Tricalbin n=1 Tax=Multifurca ochricompacta TaxID=376703 RepID=A0AAD4QTV7_9AGAM|nr:tricalbin [Multifurca ochricompacta]
MASSLPPNGLSPTSVIRAHAQANDILQKDAARGNVAVHSFNPDASPAEKAAVAGQERSKLSGVVTVSSEKQINGEVAIDSGNGNDSLIPTITIEDVDEEQVKDVPQFPGDYPTSKAAHIPDWYKVGWRAFTDDKTSEDVDQKQLRLMNSWISEQYYGEWYYNAAVIIFAVLASHYMTRFNLGWGWLFILLGLCSTYYTTSMAQVRQRARDDIQRELVKTRLASEDESAEWINNFLERFWLIYEPILSATIVASVDQILSTSCPPFLDSLRLTQFTLGNKAPRIDKVRTFPKTEEDEVLMNWNLSFIPNDVSDLTPRQLATKSNPKVVLSIRVGKGPASANFPVLVEDVAISGLLRIRLKLMNNFPHVQLMDISFLEKPLIDYVLKPIGGETFGFDMMNIPGLSSFIRDAIHSVLEPMMYEPNVFTLNLEQLLSGTPVDAAIGVIKVTVYGARSIKGGKIGGGTPDPYVSFTINNRTELTKTKYKNNTHNPTWNESKFLLINRLTDNLVLTVMDYNDHRKDTELGASIFELSKLDEDATQENLSLPILKDGKERGELRFDVLYFPVLKPQVNESGVEELLESSIGIVRFTIHQGKDLDTSRARTTDLNSYAKVFLGNATTPIHTTPRIKHTLQPVWESATEFLCTNRSSSIITVKVIDDRDFLKDPVVGHLSIRLQDLLDARKETGRDWWPLSGCKSGRLRLTVEWKPLNMAGSLHGTEQYVPPRGAVRLWLKKATDVKNVEAGLGGKSDPYVRVLVNNTIQARTEVINNNLNPEWDQIIYTPVHSLRETLLLEVMDYQHLTKDRSLGTVELKVSELAQEKMKGSGDPHYAVESTGKKDKSEPIRLDRENEYKGHLHYLAEFLPAFALQGLTFESGPNEFQSTMEGVDGDNDVNGDVASSSSSSSGEGESVDRGITVTEPIGMPKGHAKNQQSADTTRTAVSTNGTEASKTVGSREGSSSSEKSDLVVGGDSTKHEDEGIEISKDELLTYQSGIIIFHVKSGELSKKGRLEVLLDDGYWPAFSTTRALGHRAAWQHVGEGFLKELDFGRVWLRLNEADEGEKDDIFGEWKGDAKSFLSQTLGTPAKFQLVNRDDRVTGTVEIETRYVPVPVVLEPRESINNQGSLRISLLTGHDVPAVDRGGKSDPFAVFTLNGQQVYKSQTKKKTLNPEWYEDFLVSVSSRVGADFQIEVFDWNQLEQAKSLGSAKIHLEDIEPFVAVERTLTLSSEKRGSKGQIKITMVFQPEIIVKSRKNTSTFSSAGRTMTAIGSAPINAGKGVLHGVANVFRRGKDSDDDHGLANWGTQPEPKTIPDIMGTQISQPVVDEGRLGIPVSSSSMKGLSVPSEPGVLRVSALDAKDLTGGPDVKPYAIVRIGEKEHKTKHAGKTIAPEWNERFDFPVGPSTTKLYVSIFDHKTLGKDRLLGEVEVDIWQHIQPVGNSAADVSAEIKNGQGVLKLRLTFGVEPTPLGRKSSVSYPDQSVTGTLTSPSRFSLRGRRPGLDKEE